MPAFMDNIGPFMLFFVGSFISTNIFGLGIASVILGNIVNFLGLCALLFISGYAPAINFGVTPNKLKHGVKVMKLVNKETMEVRIITKSDMALMMGRAFIGWLEAFFIIPILIPYLMISNSKNRQTITDMIFGTIVIKTNPVEKFTMKDFNFKPSDGKDPTQLSQGGISGEPSVKATSESPIPTTRVEKSELKQKEIGFVNQGLFNIGKLILIISSIILVVRVFIATILEILYTVDQSLFFFSLSGINIGFIYTLNTVFMYIGIIALVGVCAGLFLITFSLKDEDRKNFLITSIIFGIYFLLRIIRTFVPAGSGILIGSFTFAVSYGFYYRTTKLVLHFILVLLLIAMIIFLNLGIKNLKEKYNMQIKPFTVHIALIVFLIFQIVLAILSVAEATDIFAVVLFYIVEVVEICFLLTFLTVYARLMKLRKIEFS